MVWANLENVVFSPSGLWGALFASGGHALLGATTDVMREIKVMLPDLDHEPYEFLDIWKHNASIGELIDWIPPLLRHVYGPEKADHLMKATNLFELLHPS